MLAEEFKWLSNDFDFEESNLLVLSLQCRFVTFETIKKGYDDEGKLVKDLPWLKK